MRSICTSIVATLVLAGTVHSQAVQWTVAEGGNGHWYQAVLVGEPVTWNEASDQAVALGGYLVTLTSQAEDEWLFQTIVNNSDLWNSRSGPLIGAFQNLESPLYSEPDGGWEWVSGESWNYTNWKAGQPDNWEGNEHFAHFKAVGDGPPLDQWNDLATPTLIDPIAFIVEYDPDDGNATAWGNNGYGQCDVPAGETFVQVAAGTHYTIGLRKDGTTIAWGENSNGQCDVPAGETFAQVACGGYHAIGLRTDSTAIAWGNNGHGQCNVPAGETFVQVAAGVFHTFGLREDGTAIAWGSNDDGQCNVPADETFVQVSAGYAHTIGLRADGTAIAWGLNNHGQCNVPAGEIFVQVAADSEHTIGLRADGTAIAWGGNNYGQCDVPAGETFVAVAAGYEHTIGLREEGTAIAWGENSNGQCDVPAGETFAQVACGGYHTIGILAPPEPTGACCTLGACTSSLTESQCTATGGTWYQETVCEDVICPPDCVGDDNGDGFVNVQDLLAVIDQWGECDDECSADFNGDGQVSIADLLIVLAVWGPCP